MDPTTFTFAGFNWLGLVVALVVNIVIGFVWYAKWFPTGRAWMKHMGMDPDNMPKPPGGAMAMSMVVMLIGTFLLWFVFAHNVWVYQDAFGNTATHGTANYKVTWMDGLTGGIFTWLGFIVPLNLNRVAFERMKWGLFFINVSYYLIAFVAGGIILCTVGSFGNPA